MKSQIILDHPQILQKIKRLAYQVIENNFEETEIVIAGIDGIGYALAEALKNELELVSDKKLAFIKVSLDKFQPTQSAIELDIEANDLEGKCIILVDDVLNTGRTLAYSLKPFLKIPIKKIQTLVLVDRGNHTFPISADFSGYSLSTTLMQHIRVTFENENWAVFLD